MSSWINLQNCINNLLVMACLLSSSSSAKNISTPDSYSGFSTLYVSNWNIPPKRRTTNWGSDILARNRFKSASALALNSLLKLTSSHFNDSRPFAAYILWPKAQATRSSIIQLVTRRCLCWHNSMLRHYMYSHYLIPGGEAAKLINTGSLWVFNE